MTDTTVTIWTVKTPQLADAGAVIIANAGAGKAQSTRRKMAESWTRFAGWASSWADGIGKPAAGAYRDALALAGLAPRSINQHLGFARAFVREAAALGFVAEAEADRFCEVGNVTERGTRLGNWLSVDDAQRLLDTPNVKTPAGVRDRALLAVLLFGGLRRAEAAALTVGQLQTRDGHHIIADIFGKHGRIRSVKMPVPVWRALDKWLGLRGPLDAGAPVFVAVTKAGAITGAPISGQAVWDIVVKYAARIGKPDIRPHDLRRTFAKLARKGGAKLEAISVQLGHARLDTTQRYLGTDLDWDNAAADAIVGLVRVN